MLSPISVPKRQTGALPIEQWFERPGWDPVPPAEAGASVAKRGLTLVLGDLGHDGAAPTLADALVARLSKLGPMLAVGRGERFRAVADPAAGVEAAWTAAPGAVLDPTSSADAEGLVAWLARSERWPRRIVVAWGVEHSDPGEQKIEASLQRGLHSLLVVGRALARSGDRRPLSLIILTAGAYNVDGGELADPGLAAALGPVRVLPLELPHMSVRQIDLQADAAATAGAARARLAAQVLAESEAADEAPLIALRGGVRWMPSLEPLELPETAGRGAFRREGVYLITGGLGGIGLAVAEHLAATERAQLVLVSRTPAPARERWVELVRDGDPGAPEVRVAAALQRIEALGGRVSHYAADVADRDALRAIREQLIAAHGRLDGIIHAAGVAGGGLVEVRERADIDRVLAAKVDGTLAVADTFADLAPDVMVLCSSLTSFVGGVGQIDYCAANAFLDAYPDSGLPLSDRTLVINWGGLLGSGLWIPREGDVGMPMPDAVAALRRALGAGPRPRIVIAPVRVGDARPWLPARRHPALAGRKRASLAERLGALWAEMLGEPSVPPDGDFFALGGNSLLAVELLWAVADVIGIRLPMQLLIENPTPAGASRAIEAHESGPGRR
jgi:phthiocerol/phenolphthiocerol synthesis type-I polyketide synthase E